MNKVYVNWYGRTVDGEVVNGSGFAGMTPVRIPLDGHHPVALFMPQHVFASADEVKGNSPIISQNSPKVEAEPREISRIEPKVSPKDYLAPEELVAQVYVSTLVQQFKESHWDEDHNHLQTEYLEEFYQLWRKTHDRRQPNAEALVTCQSHTPKPMSVQPVPQNRTPSIAKLSHKKMRCWRCEHLDYDHINARQEKRLPGEHYCGLHGMARVDPDGPQQNLDHKGGCGFIARKQTIELSLFD